MNREIKTSVVRLDPRTKLILIILTVIIATMAKNLIHEGILVVAIAALSILYRKPLYAVIHFCIYMILTMISYLWIDGNSGMIVTMVSAWLSLIFQVYPCGMMAGLVISTTKVSEFITGMNRIRIPQKGIITMAVMLRYIPTIKEDWHYIKDAMKLRGVAISVKNIVLHPLMTMECLYVPLLLAASKAADDLTVAAIARGIENPTKRTSMIRIKIRVVDVAIVVLFIAFAIYVICGGGSL